MIYLDNAATSFPKPEAVRQAVADCLLHYCANPGRGGHKLALRAARAVYGAREAIAAFFNIDDPLRVIFTSGATESLNLALKGVLRPGDHVITTSMEHNSVLRPLSRLQESGVEVTVLSCAKDGALDIQAAERQVRANTKMIVCTHASNLTGAIMPIEALGALCEKRGLLFLVDAAQSAGVLDIDVQQSRIDLLAATGHKSLAGLPGVGILYIGKRADVTPLKEGGTGSGSAAIVQPETWPDRYESGTLNLPGIVALHAGLAFIEKTGIDAIQAHEKNLTRLFLDGVRNIQGLTVYGHTAASLAIVPLNLAHADAAAAAHRLDERFGICTRAGLHCAPAAHETIGTLQSGAVRFSFGYFNTEAEIRKAIDALYKISVGAK